MTASPVPPPPPPSGPTGWIDLTLQGSVMTSSFMAPTVLLNGFSVPTHYGQNVYPVPPGRWQVDVSCQWMLTYGQASIVVDVPEGRSVPVFYASPFHQFSKGAIGQTRQKKPGLVGMLALLGVILLFVVGVVTLASLAGG